MLDKEDVNIINDAAEVGCAVYVILTSGHREPIKSVTIDGVRAHFDIVRPATASLTVRLECIAGYTIEA